MSNLKERIAKNPRTSILGGILAALAANEQLDGEGMASMMELLASSLESGGAGRSLLLVGAALWLLYQKDSKD